jgi:hypothetical protein
MNQSIDYVVEAYPVSAEELVSKNYVEEICGITSVFDKMHQ